MDQHEGISINIPLVWEACFCFDLGLMRGPCHDRDSNASSFKFRPSALPLRYLATPFKILGTYWYFCRNVILTRADNADAIMMCTVNLLVSCSMLVMSLLMWLNSFFIVVNYLGIELHYKLSSLMSTSEQLQLSVHPIYVVYLFH